MSLYLYHPWTRVGCSLTLLPGASEAVTLTGAQADRIHTWLLLAPAGAERETRLRFALGCLKADPAWLPALAPWEPDAAAVAPVPQGRFLGEAFRYIARAVRLAAGVET